MNRKNRIATVALAAAITATGLIALAGDLNPPPGAVAPTMKTLAEVEPRIAINAPNTPGDADSLFKITQPGSYYLTGNIAGLSGKHGIMITASGVTLDLNGFDLAGGAGTLYGVFANNGGFLSIKNVAVVNGSVRNWGFGGVNLSLVDANSRVEAIHASGNVGDGIAPGTGGATVSNCSASFNGTLGINATQNCTITNCSASYNGGSGISANNGSTITNCSAFSNGAYGVGGSYSVIIANCSATYNASGGIVCGDGCTVIDCSAGFNSGDGIVCGIGGTIRGNTCFTNGRDSFDGAGIHAIGVNNRIEDNNCTACDRGIDVDAAGNIIIRNTCSGNTTNWDIVANNVCGPILNRTAPASAAILGNSAPSSLGSTDANANFTY